MRDQMVEAWCDKAAPATNKCISCNEIVRNIVLCTDCGPTVYFCVKCTEIHHKFQYLHKPLLWTVRRDIKSKFAIFGRLRMEGGAEIGIWNKR